MCPIYAIRTTANKEKTVAGGIADRVKKKEYDIYSLVVSGLKGYVLIEGERDDIEKVYKGLPHARGVVAGEASISELDHFLVPEPTAIKLKEGYIVEISGGPFKGERAKITRVDKAKGDVTLELLEATVPIPITVTADSVRILEKTGDEEKAEEEKKDDGKTKS